jgi:hypothetical protein
LTGVDIPAHEIGVELQARRKQSGKGKHAEWSQDDKPVHAHETCYT